MAVSAEFVDFLKEQMAGLGPVSVRRMFSGAGFFRDGLMFALVVDDVLYLKADEGNRPEFDAESLEPFSYATSKGENTLTSYRRAPESCFDDPDEMTRWCRGSFEAALRAGARKPKSARRRASDQ